jgi:hypothetical protein
MPNQTSSLHGITHPLPVMSPEELLAQLNSHIENQGSAPDDDLPVGPDDTVETLARK